MERKFPHTNPECILVIISPRKYRSFPKSQCQFPFTSVYHGKSHLLFFSPNPLTRSLYMLMRAEQHPVLSCWQLTDCFHPTGACFFVQMGCWQSEINKVGWIHDCCCCFLSVGVTHESYLIVCLDLPTTPTYTRWPVPSPDPQTPTAPGTFTPFARNSKTLFPLN